MLVGKDTTVFMWARKTSGYQITDKVSLVKPTDKPVEPIRPPFIVPVDPVEELSYYDCFDPENKKNPMLFENFTEIRSESQLIAFANRWGLLTKNTFFTDEDPTHPKFMGESKEFWWNSIADMRYVCQLTAWLEQYNNAKSTIKELGLEFATEKDLQKLEPKLENDLRSVEKAINDATVCMVRGIPGIWIDFESVRYRVGSALYDKRPYHRIMREGNTPIIRITIAIQEKVNSMVDKFPATPRLMYHLQTKQLVQCYYPSNLLGFMWGQIFQGVTKERIYKWCPSCGKFFDLTDNKGRTRWKKCTGCKNRDNVAASRKRKKAENV